MPALAAWTGFLLCRHVTRNAGASFVGGYLFGFSSYMLGHEVAGHLNLIGVFVLPLVALALVRYVRGDIGWPGLTWRLGLLLALQLTVSTEVLLTLTIMLLLALLLGLAFLRGERRRLLTSLVPIAGGYAIAGALTAPFLYYVHRGYSPGTYADPVFFSADLANLVLPTRLIAIGGPSLAGTTAHLIGNLNEQDFYLGLPAIVILAAFAVRVRRSTTARFLLASFVVATIAALGPKLAVDGHRIVWLPWALVAEKPLFNNALPARFALYAWLVVAVVVALWMSAGRNPVRTVALPLLAILALVPALQRADFVQRPERWAFFSDHLYKNCVPRGETLAVFPFGKFGDSLLWQAESGFWFRMAEGNMGRSSAYPPEFVSDPTVGKLTFQFIDPTIRPTMAELLRYAGSHGVDRLVSVVIHAYPDGTMMHAFGPVQEYGGVLVAPACGYPALQPSRAPYAEIIRSRSVLEHARTLLLAKRSTEARRLVRQTAVVLKPIQANDHTNTDLEQATRLVEDAAQASPAALREASLALGRYAKHIDSGIVQS
jgi:hypothetical protein